MDYFFQEQRWTDTFLSLHVKKFKRIILFLLIAFSAAGAKAQSDVKFNGDIRYSKWVIDSRMNNFYANTTKCGFAVYNQEGTQTSPRDDGKTKLDYVVGLVAKSIIEASQYYSQYTWAQSFAKPWFLSIKDYGDNFYSKFETNGGSLDDLNAVKLFIPLRELTATNGTYPNATTYANTKTALDNAITGLNAHNTNYRIKNENILAKTAGNDVLGGWWHKSDYQDQMWLDGSYMGPALFAQLVNYSNKTTNIDSSNDWNLIVNQFTILRNMCWNSDDKLLYHAFAADGGTNTTSHSDTWYGLNSTDNYCFHSASYWGRAVGWYFLALVDVLEQMEKANIASTDSKFTTLKGYLEEIAEGIKNHQDQTTGGWYQILDKGSDYSASSYDNGQQHTTTYNYIESSATALFTAAYLKAIRKGYLDRTTYKTVAEDGYKCLVNNFFSVDENGKVNIFGSCRSAGLGGKGDDYKKGNIKYRNGSNEYYLLGSDVARVDKSENETEGKVLGAFIMAATEYEIANEKAIRFSYDLAPTYTLAKGGSIKAEALGSGTITYQWYNASDNSLVFDGQTFAPTESGTYYCKATNESTTIQTSKTVVTVEGASNSGNSAGVSNASFVYTSEGNAYKSGSSFTVNNITVSSGGSTSNSGYLQVPGSKSLTITPPNGVTITNVTITWTDNSHILKTSTGDPQLSTSGTTSSWVGSSTSALSWTNSSSTTARINSIVVTYTTGTPSTPTTHTVTATAVNGNVTISDGSNTITSGSQVEHGKSLTFTATPNEGYQFSSWTVTGTQGTADGATYTIASLEAETAVTATFTETSSGGGNNDQKIYKYQVSKAGLPAPAINSSKYITTTEDETGNTGTKLVKMTFGGWRWKGGKYIKPGGTNEITDSWTDSETEEAAVTDLDGFKFWFRGTQDAAHEKKDSVMTMYGKPRYGWFVSPKRENGITTDSYPYTLPVRGSFMTFEPTKNGTLTIYILQNGVWNTFDKETKVDGVTYAKGAIKPGEFRMHAFQITNQRGLVLAEFAPTYSVTNNQMVDAAYSCSNYTDRPKTFDKTSKDVSKWEEFWTLSDKERQAVHDSWSDPKNGGCQKIIKLDNGSFLAIQKAVVKYQFHVTGNETYYFFSNFSKMGFSGATFQPDADSGQPTDVATFSGDNSLDDTKAYTQIEKVEDGKIGDTGLTNYKYTIGGKEVGKVTGVFIPQFKAITLKRTFKPNQWTTLSLPFNLTQTEVEQIFGKGTQIIVFDKAKITSARTYLTFFYHEIQNVLPGYPYLIRPTLEYADGSNNSNSADYAPRYTIDEYGNLTEFTVYNKAINPHITQHEFKSDGYTAKCTPSYCTANEYYNNINYSKRYKEGDIFVSEGNGTVYISGGQSYGKGYRSYIDYTGTTTPAKALSISFSGVEDDDDNGTTTEIRIAELADDVIQTLGIGGVYNLNGQKVADTTRNLPAGIYIVNGRKFVVK